MSSETSNTKWWLDSQTIQGGLMTLVPTIIVILSFLGVSAHQTEVVTIVNAIAGIFGAIGVVNVIIGRNRAKTAITFKK